MTNDVLINIWKEIIISSWISNEKDLVFLCKRRNDWILFFDNKKDIYIRFWREGTKKEFDLQKKFLSYNFQVPEIIFSQEKWKYFFYVEKSLWNEVLWKQILKKSITYKEWYKYLYNVLENFLKSQKLTINNDWNLKNIISQLYMDNFKKEVLKLKIIKSDFIDRLYNKIYNELINNKYFVLTHGDFNSWNIFKKGFIDVEDSYNWIMWYDFISLITHQYWFPLEWERRINFSFFTSDIKKMIRLYNDIFNTNIEKQFNLLFILRWIWACSWMEDFPEEQEFRFKRFKKYAEKYLNWESILKFFLEEVNNINQYLKNKEKQN